MNFSLLLNFSMALLAIVNPVGKIPVWLQTSTGLDQPVAFRLAFLITLTAFIVLGGALIGGKAFLNVFSIDIPAFRMGGGVILFTLALQMLRGNPVEMTFDDEADARTKMQQAKMRFRKTVVPMAIPLIAGPGSIITVVLYGTKTDDWVQYAAMTAVLAIVMVIAMIVMLTAPYIRRLVGPIVLEVQTRLFGILIAGVAAQLILEGVSEAFPVLIENGTGLQKTNSDSF